MAALRDAFGFPAFVNEKAARVVAGGVVVLAATALLTGWLWLSAVLAVGFAPRLGAPKIVPGPPKRFAQTVGLVLTLAATAFLVAGQPVVTTALLAVLLVFATLESVVGFCAGCWVFGLLMRAGVVPDDVCLACSDITLRQRQTASA